jgi:hypothetical protein
MKIRSAVLDLLEADTEMLVGAFLKVLVPNTTINEHRYARFHSRGYSEISVW